MSSADRMSQVQTFINHHMVDSHEWQLPFLPPLHLPQWLSAHSLTLLLSCAVMAALFIFAYRRDRKVPGRINGLLEVIIVYIRDDISIANLGEKDGRRMAPLFCHFFFFILIMNLFGLIPCFAAATSNINVTCALASVTLLFMTAGAIFLKGPKAFLCAFMPSGVPWPMLIILTPLEFVSMLVRTCALMIRLFANILAGHIVIFSMIGMIVSFGYLLFPPMIIMAVAVYLLELFTAFLQAYIFTLLSAVFMGLIYHPAH